MERTARSAARTKNLPRACDAFVDDKLPWCIWLSAPAGERVRHLQDMAGTGLLERA
jgi:hypothetical protein